MSDSTETITTGVLVGLFERATISAWIIDADETILMTNRAAAELTGYAVEDLVGQPISMLMTPELAASHASYIDSYLSRPGRSSILGQAREFEIVRKDGRRVAIELKAFALPESPDGRPLFGAFISDTSAQKRIKDEMMRAARHDYLIGCLNRLGFMERAHQELSRAKRNHRPLSLIVMDIDHFKRINDTQGHQGGDKVLSELLGALGESLRAQDVFGRVGGEEFFILLPETGNAEAALVAERLRLALAQHAFICNRTAVPVTASFGSASLRADDDLDRLIQRADRRMYQAKNAGRNRVISRDVVRIESKTSSESGSDQA